MRVDRTRGVQQPSKLKIAEFDSPYPLQFTNTIINFIITVFFKMLGGVVLMGTRCLCTAELRVRFSPPPPNNRGLGQWPAEGLISLTEWFDSITRIHNRTLAQPGSASALGAEGRRFESYMSDQFI